MPAVPPLWAHQKKTKLLLSKQPRTLDLSDPGTGKTRAALEVFAERGKGRAIVLAPKTLLETAWAEDAMKFLSGPDVRVAYAENREEAFSEPADIYITNLDAAKWLAKQGAPFWRKLGKDLSLIIDELPAFKHQTSDRSKALKKIKDYFKYREGMTGTFTPLSILDAWHQVFVIDDGKRLGKSYYHFRSAVCAPVLIDRGNGKQATRWEDKQGAEEAVYGLLKDISVRHEFDKCMDIPPNQVVHRNFIMNKKHRKAYEDMAENAILFAKDTTITAVHAASLRTKLLQIASGAVYDGNGKYVVLDEGRNELICDLIEERRESVTFFNWRHQKEQLQKELKRRKISYAVLDGTTKTRDRAPIVKDYQDGRYRTLLLHPATGAHGLTLTRGKHIIWCSPIDQADYLKQGIHRIVRGGQTERTETVFVQATNTIESKVYARTFTKQKRMMTLMDLFSED